ncbi:hypothetical protein GCM10009557_85640 [Virgisporangium ochraceum]|uniref:Uncharacterized protein n=1 Tax=Virgisporangium ochraceum TaxID=65505 RepID=A0A8J4A803_9ACTN|nr:hypothetical protein [Virgisporangium ochraceum]GIJ74601.1 hypothetical protein Voc01_095180 [Virgisporangium ochraceum]
MTPPLTPAQRTQVTELITAVLFQARAAALTAGADPVRVRRVVACRITALGAVRDRDERERP